MSSSKVSKTTVVSTPSKKVLAYRSWSELKDDDVDDSNTVESKSSKRVLVSSGEDSESLVSAATRSSLCTDSQLQNKTLRSNLSRLMTTHGLKGNKGGFVTTVLNVHGLMTSSGSGSVLGVVPMDPSSSTEWSTFATLFDEFRILHARFESVPVLTGSTTAGMIVCAFDNDDATAPVTIDEVMSYQNSTLHSASKAFRFTVKRPNQTASAYWVDIASPATSAGSIKVVYGYTAASVNIAYYRMHYTVEFRGRR